MPEFLTQLKTNELNFSNVKSRLPVFSPAHLVNCSKKSEQIFRNQAVFLSKIFQKNSPPTLLPPAQPPPPVSPKTSPKNSIRQFLGKTAVNLVAKNPNTCLKTAFKLLKTSKDPLPTLIKNGSDITDEQQQTLLEEISNKNLSAQTKILEHLIKNTLYPNMIFFAFSKTKVIKPGVVSKILEEMASYQNYSFDLKDFNKALKEINIKLSFSQKIKFYITCFFLKLAITKIFSLTCNNLTTIFEKLFKQQSSTLEHGTRKTNETLEYFFSENIPEISEEMIRKTAKSFIQKTVSLPNSKNKFANFPPVKAIIKTLTSTIQKYLTQKLFLLLTHGFKKITTLHENTEVNDIYENFLTKILDDLVTPIFLNVLKQRYKNPLPFAAYNDQQIYHHIIDISNIIAKQLPQKYQKYTPTLKFHLSLFSVQYLNTLLHPQLITQDFFVPLISIITEFCIKNSSEDKKQSKTNLDKSLQNLIKNVIEEIKLQHPKSAPWINEEAINTHYPQIKSYFEKAAYFMKNQTIANKLFYLVMQKLQAAE